MAFGVFAITQAASLEYWSQIGPGSGFIPLWASIIIVVGAAAQIVLGFAKGLQKKSVSSKEAKRRLLQVFMVAALTVLTVITIDLIGFSLPTFVLSILLVRWIGQHSLKTTLTYSICITAAFYLVFVVALKVPLPKGFMGF